jgi:hypothetical protein
MLGKAPFFLIYCLSARTARKESLPTSDKVLLFPSDYWLQFGSTRFIGEPEKVSNNEPLPFGSKID